MKWQLHLSLAAVLSLAACGTPGALRPPSLELPQPVNDLAATRQGDKVTLTWTPPRETTDKQNIRHPGPVRVCRDANTTAMVQCPQVAELPPDAGAPPSKRSKPEQRTYVDTLPAALQQQNPSGFATYALESLNARGRSAGLSNQVQVPLAPTLPPPTDLRAQVTPEGVVLTWTGALHEHEAPELRHFYRVYRRTPETPLWTVVGEVQLSTDPQARFLDTSFAWGKTYLYRVVVVTSITRNGTVVQVEGEPSAELTVVVHDVFPPAAPTDVQAVASGVGQPAFVDLTWAPNTEPDLAGYNVYRREEGQQPVKINAELVKTPTFRDRGVASGHRYFYSVTAVDLRGNESSHSTEASESVP
jgi:predicted small lipoprotein YifL